MLKQQAMSTSRSIDKNLSHMKIDAFSDLVGPGSLNIGPLSLTCNI